MNDDARDVDDLVAEYTELLRRDKKEARKFFDDHSGSEEFVELAKISEEFSRRAKRRNLVTATVVLIPVLVLLVAFGWVGYQYYRAQQWRAQFVGEVILRQGQRSGRSGESQEPGTLPKMTEASDVVLESAQSALHKELDRETREQLYLRALEAYSNNHHKEALELLERIETKFGPWSKIHNFRAFLHTRGEEKDFELAKREYEKAIELNREEVWNGEDPLPGAYNNLAILLVENARKEGDSEREWDKGALQEARGYIDKAISLDEKIQEKTQGTSGTKLPTDVELLDTSAQVYTAMGDANLQQKGQFWYDAASEAYTKAIESATPDSSRRKQIEADFNEFQRKNK